MTYEEVLNRLREIARKLNETEQELSETERIALFQKLNKCIYDFEVIGNKLNQELDKIRKAIEEQL